MSINFNAIEKTFHLKTQNTSYIMGVFKEDYLAHLYYGKRLKSDGLQYVLRFEERAHIMVEEPFERSFSLETMPQEYPAFGAGDLKCPAYQVENSDGNYISDARYVSHTIYQGKKQLEGLPALYEKESGDVETLEIVLVDPVIELKIILSYSVFENYDVITRSVKFINESSKEMRLLKALSASVDFAREDFEILHLRGGWARENRIERSKLVGGRIELESIRGVSSSQHNPFFALLHKETTEDHGSVYGFNLVYSGNFLSMIEVDQYNQVRAAMGINPQNFSWRLPPQGTFQTPECVMVYTDKGIGDMSRKFHKIYRERLCKSKFANKPRPIAINSWEASYFDFTEDSLCQLAEEGKKVGIELLVLDDGWFGKRNNDKSSLGDWGVNLDKLPSGLDGLAKKINDIGLQFGIWIEPEMISPDSDLFRLHPEWRLHVPGRVGHQSRNQYVLDLSRADMITWLKETFYKVLNSASITYVKWDMNRHLSEVGSAAFPASAQGEIYHRYVLGLYDFMDYITSSFPDILFEGCEGGGGRFDAGMLHYVPQIWTSDNTDAVERLAIQYGTSIVYPLSTILAHYSTTPNHQVGRNTSPQMRAIAAMTGSYGYEINLTEISDEEKADIAGFNALYKKDRELLAVGDFYRLISPIDNNCASWMSVSKDQSKAIVHYFNVLAHPNLPFEWVRLKGLVPEKCYYVEEIGNAYYGDELQNIGLPIPRFKSDYQALAFHLTETN